LAGVLLLLVLLVFPTTGRGVAGDLVEEAEGTKVWEAGIDGVRIEWAADGTFNRLFSRVSQPVLSGDRTAKSSGNTHADQLPKMVQVPR
jgi:hypothetical protein